MTKDKLISLCERAVVPCEKWSDRDSAIAQNHIQEIHARLSADIPFSCSFENDTIFVSFKEPTEEQIKNISLGLSVDTVSDYRERVSDDPDDEMFEPFFYSSDCIYRGFLPTEERLNEVNGSDWY
jgi:hypothetical protein